MKTPYRLFSSLVDLEPHMNFKERVYVDTETCGLYGKIRLLQVYQESWDTVAMVEWPNVYGVIKFLNRLISTWHNAHYDVTVCQTLTGTRWCPEQFDDTFLLARLALPHLDEYSLDAVMLAVLKHDPYKLQMLDKKKLQKANWNVPKLSEDQLLYAATDVYYMPQVFDAVHEKLDSPSYKLDMSTLRSCLNFQWNGMPVDADRLGELYKSNEAKIAEANVPINVNSWQQVRPYIGELDSDDLALARYELQGNERAKMVRMVRKLRKQNSFLDKFDNIEGRIYGKFKPSARSGRLTSSDQNLQQLPRSTKSVFGYKPDDGRVLIFADYAQLELRTICAITQCKAMEDLFRAYADLHGYTAEMLFGKDWTKPQRQLSKTYNFSFLYGGGIHMLISILIKTAGVLLNEAEANRDRKRWRNLWKEIFAWQERGIRQFQQGRLGSTPLGRQYKAKLTTDQLNIENQGAGAEVANLALHYLMPELAKHPEAFLANMVHDCFIIDCVNDPAVYEKVAEDLAKCMQEAWFEMSKLFKINDLPMPVTVKVGYNWGDIESDDVVDLYTYSLTGMEYYNATV